MTSRSGPNEGRLSVETVGDEHAIRIILRGEADIGNLADLDIALTGIELDGTMQVQLHVSELAFLDVAALRQLTLFAQQLKETGYTVTTHGAQPMVDQLVRLVGVDDDLGLA